MGWVGHLGTDTPKPDDRKEAFEVLKKKPTALVFLQLIGRWLVLPSQSLLPCDPLLRTAASLRQSWHLMRILLTSSRAFCRPSCGLGQMPPPYGSHSVPPHSAPDFARLHSGRGLAPSRSPYTPPRRPPQEAAGARGARAESVMSATGIEFPEGARDPPQVRRAGGEFVAVCACVCVCARARLRKGYARTVWLTLFR